MNIPYQSIYDEAISDRVLQKIGSKKFASLNIEPSSFEIDRLKNLISKITTLKKELSTLLKKCKTQFKTLDKNSLKLKLKDDSYYKSYKQTLWADNISSSYSDNISDVVFPGAFGKTIEQIQLKVNELLDIYKSTDFIVNKSKIPKNLRLDHLTKDLNLDNSSSFDKGLENSIRLGITPANHNGFYRLHMTNSPPDAFKSGTGGIGLGKYLYLAVIHHCGHGYTDGSSDDALKVWNHVVKKRKDIYSFIAQDEIGEDYVLAISIKVPKDDVLQILDRWISAMGNSAVLKEPNRNFLGWLKYRKERYGDEAIDLLDDGLYDLFKKEIEELNVSIQCVIQTSDNDTIKIENLQIKLKDEENKMTFDEAIRNAPKDYRLPTQQDVSIIFNNKDKLNFKDSYYWSSDESILVFNIRTKSFTRASKSGKFFVRYVKEIEKSNTKSSNTLSNIVIEKTKMTFDEAKRKYGDTLLKESDLTEEIQDEIIGFFKNGNNADLLTNPVMGSKFYFWLNEESLLNLNSFKVCKYNPNNEDFNYFFNNPEAEYYVVHFKNKTSNNSNTSQGFGKSNRANQYIMIDDKKTYVQHEIMFEDNMFDVQSLGESSSSHTNFNNILKNLIKQNKPVLENGKFIFWCKDDDLPCIGKYDVRGNYTNYTTLPSDSLTLEYSDYYTIVKNF